MRRLALLVAAAALAAVLFVVLRPGNEGDEPSVVPAAGMTTGGATPAATTTAQTTGDGEPSDTAPTVIVLRDGRVRGGVERLRFERGDRIMLVVRADVADQVHVHGFDLFADVAPGRPARFTFRADLTGSFEIELEDRHVPLAQLQVRP